MCYILFILHGLYCNQILVTLYMIDNGLVNQDKFNIYVKTPSEIKLIMLNPNKQYVTKWINKILVAYPIDE